MPRNPFARKKTFMDHASDLAETALETLESAFDSAKEAAKEAGANAKDAAGPVVADARDRAVPLLQEGRAVAAEKAAAGAALAREKAAEAADLAAQQAAAGRDLAAAKLAEVKGEPEPKGGKFKKFLLFSGLLAIGGFVYSKLRSKQESDNWQSSYVPPPPPPRAPAPSATDNLADPLNDPLPGQEGTSDDPGGAGPGEAVSDAADEPHEATTPDAPAESVDVEDAMIRPLDPIADDAPSAKKK